MSASEKLRGLVGDFWENEPPEGPEAPDAVIAAIPQLLAVTDAAERYVTARDAGEQGHIAHLRAALTALEEALS